MSSRIPRAEYLQKDFDYTRLTKQELRAIMSENNVPDIPPVTALKSTIIDAYKAHIHDKIDLLKHDNEANFSRENIFQSFSEPAVEETKNNVEIALPTASDSHHEVSSARPVIVVGKNHEGPDKVFINPNTSFINASNLSIYGDSKTFHSDVSRLEDTFGSTVTELARTSISQEIKQKQRRKALRFFNLSRIILIVFLSFAAYLKFYCPYCVHDKTGQSLCILPPPNGEIVEGRLRCNSGYILIKGIVDHCALDTTEEDKRLRKADEIIRLLESIKGSAEYGFGISRPVRLSELSEDKEVIALICKSGKVICSDGLVEAIHGRIGIRLLFRYYLTKATRFILPLLLLIGVIKVGLWRRKRRLALERKAKDFSRRAMELLSRQLVYAARSHLFLPHVREDKLRDALGIEGLLWEATRRLLLRNANVSLVEAEGGCCFQWTGPLLSDD